MYQELQKYNFHNHHTGWRLGHSLWKCFQVNTIKPHKWEMNIGSCNGLVPPGICRTISPHPATIQSQYGVFYRAISYRPTNILSQYDVFYIAISPHPATILSQYGVFYRAIAPHPDIIISQYGFHQLCHISVTLVFRKPCYTDGLLLTYMTHDSLAPKPWYHLLYHLQISLPVLCNS